MKKPLSLLVALSLAACAGNDPPMRILRDAGTGTDDASQLDGAAPDAAVPDASAPDADAPDADAPDGGSTPRPARYSVDARHSRLNANVAAQLAQIRENDPTQHDDVFAKIGDSITVEPTFMGCFTGSRVNLDGRTALADTISSFAAGDAAGTTPYGRTSLAAGVGWSAWRVLEGSTPSRVVQEIEAILPRFAVVMYGSNDVEANSPKRFADNMLDLADTLIEHGVVPIMSSIPPRDDNAISDARVPLYNAIVRALAEARQVPFVDFHRELEMIPGHGLGPDNLHPNGAPTGSCDFTAAGLGYGYNVRNLITIEALDRARRVLVAGEPAPDADGPARLGSGTSADPYIVDAFPFTDSRNTSFATERMRSTYSGCSSTANEAGAEIVYTLTLTEPRRIEAWVFDRGTVDIDLHVLDASGTVAGCVARDDTSVAIDLAAGTWTLVLDTYTSSAVEHAGEYLLVVL